MYINASYVANTTSQKRMVGDMTKPDWLIEAEKKKNQPVRGYTYCKDCKHFNGKYIRETKHKGKERCAVWECAIHPGCYNTRYSIRCEDWESADII